MSLERGGPSFDEGLNYSSKTEKVRSQMDFAENLHNFYDPENSLGNLSEKIKDGAYPVIYSNHTHHINIAALRGVYSRLPARPDNFYIAVAYSLDRGDQGEGLADFTNSLKPILEEEQAHFVPVARPKDINRFRKERKFDTAKEMIRETDRNKQAIYKSLREDAGFLFFPETTTEGGVKDEKGKRKGLQPVENKVFLELLEEADKANREIAFLPLGIINANKIIEPRETNPTLRTKFQHVKSKMGLRASQLATVNIGKVFSSQDIKEAGIERSDINDFMMRRVAELLPKEARGYYK